MERRARSDTPLERIDDAAPDDDHHHAHALTPRFDSFYPLRRATQLLFDYAAAHPGWSAWSRWQDHEGRDIWSSR